MLRPRTGALRFLGSSPAGSTLVIVLWIAFGLVSLAIYFGQSMIFELRASDARVSGMAANQAIDAGLRYVKYILVNYETNGVMPDPTTYLSEAVPVGDSHFWLIGRNTNNLAGQGIVSFGLTDENSKFNLNSTNFGTVNFSNALVFLPNMTVDLTTAILDWRDTNGGSGMFDTYYGMQNPPYMNKGAPFDTVEELKLVYGADMYTLVGEDLNENGVLDPNETDDNKNGVADPGALEYLTVYSREPGTYSNGIPRVDIRTVTQGGAFSTLLTSTFGSSRGSQILTSLGVGMTGGGGPGGRGGPGGGQASQASFTSPLQLYRSSGMTVDEFAEIANAITVSDNTNYIEGRVNVNTASLAVLSCLPGLIDNPGLAQMLVNYREQNPYQLTSIAWVVDALGQNNATVLDELATTDCITTESYQYCADIAALGPHGRGYRRVRFIIDTMDGTPKVIYRQDLTHLGWALGKDVRQTWLLAAKDKQ